MAIPMREESLRLGLISDLPAHLGSLVALIKATEHEVVCSLLTSAYNLPLQQDVDAWVVRIEELSDDADTLLEWLNENDIPTVIDDVSDLRLHQSPQTAEWFTQKLRESVNASRSLAQGSHMPERVWALGASTGGPEAVLEFLSELGPAAHKNSYLYAQHIDERALPPLFESLQRKSPLQVRYCEDGLVIEPGVVYLVSPDREFEIQAGRQIVETGCSWKGPYKPSIDQVVSKVARVFGVRSAAIIFSGMADDGAAAVRFIHAAGGTIMTQQESTCAVDSMPNSALATGCVDFSGSAVELARQVCLLVGQTSERIQKPNSIG